MELQGRDLSLQSPQISGDDVALLHREIGWPIPQDEINEKRFGVGTQRAVRSFQERHGLEPTGVVDAITAARISAEVAALESRPRIVRGRVRYADGRPFVDGIVRAFDRDLRSEEILGEVRPNAEGSYVIEYTTEQFSRAEKGSADLRVCACNAAGREIRTSAIHFNAGYVETIDLVVDGDVFRGPSEYEQLVTELMPLLQGLGFADLTEDDQHQDVTFLSGETERDPRHIAFLIAAHRHASRTNLAAETFYGLFRNDLPASLPALFVQDPAMVRRALKQAAADNIIPARFGEDEEISRVLTRFKELVVLEAVRPLGEGETTAPLVALLRTVLPDIDRQEAFVRRYAAHSGPISAFWDELRGSPELGNEVDGLQFTFQVGALTGNHLPLVRELQRLRQDQEITAARDLVRFDEAGWREVLTRSSGGGIIGAPSGIPGEGAEKLANYARSLTRLTERTYPTAFVAERLKMDALEGRENLLTFFQQNQETFDINGARLETYLAEHPNALDGIAEAKRPAARQQVRAMQRVYRFAPQYKAMSKFLKDGIDSALAITRMGPTIFGLKYPELGDAAVRVYRRAENTHCMAMAIASNWGMQGSKVSTAAAPDEVPEQIEGIPDWQTLFGSLELCECEHCRSVFSPAAYLVDILHFLRDRRLIDPASIERDELGYIKSHEFISHPNDASKDLSAKDVLFRRRPDLGEIELTCENTHTPLPYVDLVNEILENYVAPLPIFAPFAVDPALVSDLDARTVSPQLSANFTAPPLSPHATIQVEKAGERWRLHDLSFTYTIRAKGSGVVEVTTRGRQTRGTPSELAANPQYMNPDAYDKLRERVFPLSLPFDLWSAEARVYLDHLGVLRHQIMEAFLAGDLAAKLADPAIGRERLGLTTADANLITGATTIQAGASDPGVWNLWGFSKATLDPASGIPDPADSTAWIAGGNWLDVLTSRVDVFLQQSGLSYKEMLALLGAYFVNPKTGPNARLITVQAHEGQPQDTCETRNLRIAGMDEDAALRALCFIRLWRKLGWTVRDLDRALAALGVPSTASLDEAVLTQLSHVQRLHEQLGLPVERLFAFWGPLDTARYNDHDATGQPLYPTMYERLFRNKNVVNPPHPAFTEDPSALAGSLSDHAAAIIAALRISATDLTLLRVDADVVPNDTLSLPNLSRLYRHATLAKALKLPVRDYLTALELSGDPFAGTTATVLFVEQINTVRAGRITLAQLDYLSRHVILDSARVAPTDEEIARQLTDIRAEMQRIAAENTFVEKEDAPGGPTVDLDGGLTRQKIALLGWGTDLIDEVVATLSDAVIYRTSLTALPSGVSLPEKMPIAYDATTQQLRFTGAMTVAQRDDLLALVTDPAFQTAVTQLFEAPRRFVQRHLRRYTIERFSAPLAALPAVTFPAALKARLYHDSEAGLLYFVGAMRDDERDALLDLSTDAAYQAAINALYAAPDTAPTTDVFLTSGPGSDVEALFDDPTTLDPPTVPAGRFAHLLRKLLPHLRAVLSERAVIQALAEALDLETQSARDLVTEWLAWTGHPGQKLLAAFLDPAFAKSHLSVAITRQAFAGQFDAFLLLHKSALVVQSFGCTPRQVRWLFTYAQAAGWPNLAALPVATQSAPAVQLQAWLRVIELFDLRDRLPRGEEALDDLLGRAVAVESSAPAAEKNAAKAAYLAALNQWTGWPHSELVVLLGQPDDHAETGSLNASFPSGYAGAALLGRLRACFSLLNRLGMSAAQCGGLAVPNVSQAVAASVKQAVRAKYDEAQWLKLAQPLRDVLREQQRAALVAYLLVNPDDQHAWRKVSEIYGHFLIDVEMSPCQMSSRIQQAISSVQFFVQRCLLSLEWAAPEKKVLASAEIDVRWREWAWMKNYRVWEANRKIWLYPENWLEPELRDDKSPFFQELESELLQTNLTEETAETAFRAYLAKLDSVARLEVVGMYHEQEEDASGNIAIDVLHVFGRTPGDYPVYFYRRRVDGRHWTAWERVDLDIEGNHLIPVVWRRRLYLIWPVFTEEPKEAETSNVVPVLKRWKIQLAWSEYSDGNWRPKKVSGQALYHPLRNYRPDLFLRSKFRFKAKIQGGSLNVEVATPGWLLCEVGIFYMGDCNGDFVLRAPADCYPLDTLTGTFHAGMTLVQRSGVLHLPTSETEDAEALKQTPAGNCRLLYAYQDTGVQGLRLRPWFFNDDVRTYFVVPRPPWLSGITGAISQVSDPGIIEVPPDPFDPGIDPGDPFRLSSSRVRLGRMINPGDPLLVEETFPVTSPLGSMPMAPTEGTSDTIVMRSQTEAPRVMARDFLDESRAGLSYVKPYFGFRYTFHTFYHPYVCRLIEELNLNGVDGLLQRPLQLQSHGTQTFVNNYDPVGNGPVDPKYPMEDMDFEYGGAYSQYNWELFCHAVLQIVNGLVANQRFDDALHWIRYILDPMDTSSLAVPQRYWRTKPFYRKTSKDYQREHIGFLMRLLASGGDIDKLTGVDDFTKKELQHDYNELVYAVQEWRKNPFKPHLVARMRTTAYQKAVVMKLLDICIGHGDLKVRGETLESINEATQLYILAADILGKRPEDIPPRALPEIHTYNSLEPLLDHFSNAFVQIEEFVPPSAISEAPGDSENGLVTMPTMLYFCVPKNDKLLAYWDIVADRLFKIRHCMTLEGVVRQLPLFAPPIEPGLLVKAVAAGVDIASVLSEVNAPLPHYRCNVLAQKATELCGELKSLGAALLAAWEKRDAEKLALLRAEQETALLKLVDEVRAQQVVEAEQQIAALKASRDIAVIRYKHYQTLLGANATVPGAPIPGDTAVAAIPEGIASADAATQDEEGIRMLSHEAEELDDLEMARHFYRMASIIDHIASVAHIIPNFNMEPYGVGTTIGGSNFGAALQSHAGNFRFVGDEYTYSAGRAGRLAQHIMRAHDWLLQSNSEAKNITHIDQQIVGQYIKKEIAQKELANHRRQIKHAQEVEDTLRDKYTNQQLYNWMIGQISTVYFQGYQLAYDVAKRAERAFRHELGLPDSNFIRFGYWDSLKKGLLAGERLLHDLKRMEVAYLDQHKREFEITKHISLVRLDPVALVQLKQTGECFFAVPEVLFDLDYPGHYMRRIKSVAVTIPCVAGPYTSVNCTLTLVHSALRRTNTLLGGKYGRDLENEDPRFADSLGAVQSIVTSSGQNDSGLFEANLRDERFLPCEGAGVISTWRIELPNEFRQFDYDTISDVVLHIRYTARAGGGLLKKQALMEMQEAVNAIVRADQAQGLAQFFSVRHEFSGEWHRFLYGTGNQTLTLSLDRGRFPFLIQDKIDKINKVELFVKIDPDFTATHDEGTLKFTLAVGEPAPTQPTDVLPLAPWNKLLRSEKGFADPPGTWSMSAWLNEGDRLDAKALEDIVLVCHYSVA